MKPTRSRLWIEILAVTSGIACVLAVFFATIGAATGGVSQLAETSSSAQLGSEASQTYDGVVTDMRCGAKHTPAVPESSADCTMGMHSCR
jgi:hypothetical protein